MRWTLLGWIAESVEQLTRTPSVPGSNSEADYV